LKIGIKAAARQLEIRAGTMQRGGLERCVDVAAAAVGAEVPRHHLLQSI